MVSCSSGLGFRVVAGDVTDAPYGFGMISSAGNGKNHGLPRPTCWIARFPGRRTRRW